MKKSLVKGIWNANEKARKMKKIFCFDICSCHYLRQNLSTSDLSFSQVTSVEKREPRKHFSASAYGLGFKNFFLGTLFSTSVTWEKLKSDVDKLCLRRVKNKYRNKILFVHRTKRFVHGQNVLSNPEGRGISKLMPKSQKKIKILSTGLPYMAILKNGVR